MISGHERYGLARFRSAPVLNAPVMANGRLAATIAGQLGWTYRVETSSDLVNWTLLRELPSAGALTEFTDLEAGNLARRFIRVSVP